MSKGLIKRLFRGKETPPTEPGDDEVELALARNVTTEELAQADDTTRLTALMRAAMQSEGSGPVLAQEAMFHVMGADVVKYVRDDDGSLWPFVPGAEYWRGPLRLTTEQSVEQARFYPDQEKIVWVSPWDK